MYRLFREVRFSVNPFGTVSEAGFNTYSSKPCGDGLSVYLSLGVELSGSLNADTGFIVNVSEIDESVRQGMIPRFRNLIRGSFSLGEPVCFNDLFVLMRENAAELQEGFRQAVVSRLVLQVNPFRKLILLMEKSPVRFYSERFEFAAMHRLWNDGFTEAENYEKFGKCANPAGHGHNYILEVTLKIPDSVEEAGWISRFQQVVQEHFLVHVDHKNLNLDVPQFEAVNPTVENISSVAWKCLDGQFEGVSLQRVTIWENDRTCCTYEEL